VEAAAVDRAKHLYLPRRQAIFRAVR
jgi:hypothetical protein